MTESITAGREWAKRVIALYEAGASDAEVAASERITIKNYYQQIGDNAAFAQLVEFGRTLSQAFWEKQARLNITNKQFNTPLWAFYMKNKFGWADKTESVNVNENNNMDMDTLRTQLSKEVGRFIKQNSPELTDAQRVLKHIGQEVENDY